MTKIGSGILNESAVRDQDFAEYVDFMTHELVSKRTQRKPLPDLSELSEEQKQEFYLSMQSESTKAAMLSQKERSPDDDLIHTFRPIPQEYLANPSASSLDELTAKRKDLDPSEVSHIQAIRHSNFNSLGDSKHSKTDKEAKERAINAFTFSKPADLSLTDIIGIKKLKEINKVQRVDATPKETKPKFSLYEWVSDKANDFFARTDEILSKFFGKDHD